MLQKLVMSFEIRHIVETLTQGNWPSLNELQLMEKLLDKPAHDLSESWPAAGDERALT